MSLPVRDLAQQLCQQAWVLGTIAVAAERGLLARVAAGAATVDQLAAQGGLNPDTARALCDVLATQGLVTRDGDTVTGTAALAAVAEPMAGKVLAADVRSALGTIWRLGRVATDASGRLEGWWADDPVLVRTQGLLSMAMSDGMIGMLKKMPDLDARLSAPGAAVLDVGAGAAGFCIAMARGFPGLRLVGLEPSPVAAAEARQAVAAAGLADRIEIRECFGQDLDETDRYAAAYVAQMFIPDDALEPVLAATLRALEPGGRLFTGAVSVPGAGLPEAISRFRNAVWGGGVRSADALLATLSRVGYVDAAMLPGPGTMTPLIARRPA